MTQINNNVDPEEIAKFAALAAHWWDEAGELKTLHKINPLRSGYICKKSQIQSSHIIDIGCGGGILSESLAAHGANVTGIDMNKSLITVAKLHQHESGHNIEYLHTSAEAIAADRPGQYDIVTCLELLEHVPNPQSVVQACATLAKPGGHIYFSTINRHPKAYLFAILGAEYLLKLIPKNTHDYAKFIRPSELNAWARQANLIPREINGIAYNPLTNEARLTDDVSVNYIVRMEKP